MKNFLKNMLYHIGVLGAYHRFKNRRRLTVAMFHRVLPVSDERYGRADPEWTMTPETFARCLDFFRRHYHVLTPAQVFAALQGNRKLPSRSLLVTFDDGWADTAEYAQPIMDKARISGLIFVAADAINQALPFWEERVYGFLATYTDGCAVMMSAFARCGVEFPLDSSVGADTKMDEAQIRSVIKRMSGLPKTTVNTLLEAMDIPAETQPAMLDTGRLVKLVASSHAIGGHGFTHRPLTKIENIDEELSSSREVIAAYLNGPSVESMSFPHGAYSGKVIERALTAGYKYLFSSDPYLNVIKTKASQDCPVGRIHISERVITDNAGKFEPAKLATSLFMRPHVCLDQKNGLRNA